MVSATIGWEEAAPKACIIKQLSKNAIATKNEPQPEANTTENQTVRSLQVYPFNAQKDLAPDDDLVDGNENKLHEKAHQSHEKEANTGRLGDLHELW